MIHAYRWEPEGQPRGVVQIIHGIAEYVPRYAGFAAFLNAHGLLVTGEDHMGHGKSHGTEPCHFSGGWCAAVDDSMELLRRTQRDYPGVPYFMLGHSMGSFLTRTLLFRYPDAGLRAAVICGTGWQPAPVLAAARRGLLGQIGGQIDHGIHEHALLSCYFLPGSSVSAARTLSMLLSYRTRCPINRTLEDFYAGI